MRRARPVPDSRRGAGIGGKRWSFRRLREPYGVKTPQREAWEGISEWKRRPQVPPLRGVSRPFQFGRERFKRECSGRTEGEEPGPVPALHVLDKGARRLKLGREIPAPTNDRPCQGSRHGSLNVYRCRSAAALFAARCRSLLAAWSPSPSVRWKRRNDRAKQGINRLRRLEDGRHIRVEHYHHSSSLQQPREAVRACLPVVESVLPAQLICRPARGTRARHFLRNLCAHFW